MTRRFCYVCVCIILGIWAFSVRFELLKDHKYDFPSLPSVSSAGDWSYDTDSKLDTGDIKLVK